jgi:GNAT superfamily N-acetyltransferase
MSITVRPAQPSDRDDIAAFTRDTFTWGDYVADAFDDWLADDDGITMVAETAGTAVGVARVTLVSPVEAWSQGARVHPDHRRRGIGTAVAQALSRWAAERGARVIRLAVEDWNEPAIGQVTSLGFRPVSHWVVAERGVGENSPVPEGNGGRRVMAPEGLRPAPAAEAAAALMAWASGPLERAAHRLFASHWRWRRLQPGDVVEAARRRALWEGRPGWAIADVDEDAFRVSWVVATEEDADAMVRALVDRAAAAGVERILATVPTVEWLVRAVRRRGCEVHPITVYSLGL